MLLALQAAQAAAEPWPGEGVGTAIRGLLAVIFVLGLLGLLSWLVRRGHLPLGRTARGGAIVVESTVPLGERRSLAIVSVEGRRLLIGMTPAQVGLVAELAPVADAGSFGQALGAAEHRAVTPGFGAGREPGR
ncbi:MAG: flagellar biosynthetic protein FliO [Vicinamibacterales bacterium]